MPQIAKDAIRHCSESFKRHGWKKIGISFAKELDDDTISFVAVFEKERHTIRAQGQTVSRSLNRTRWKIFGIEGQLGSLKDHVNNHAACFLFNSLIATESNLTGFDAEPFVATVVRLCTESSRKFQGISNIQMQLDLSRAELRDRLDEQQLCLHVRNGNRFAAASLIENKRSMPGFELSFFAHAERYLRRLS